MLAMTMINQCVLVSLGAGVDMAARCCQELGGKSTRRMRGILQAAGQARRKHALWTRSASRQAHGYTTSSGLRIFPPIQGNHRFLQSVAPFKELTKLDDAKQSTDKNLAAVRPVHETAACMPASPLLPELSCSAAF